MAEEAFGDPAYAFVKTSFPKQHITEIMKANVDRGIPAFVVPENELHLLSKPEIINLNEVRRLRNQR